jgi:hypothetical protein
VNTLDLIIKYGIACRQIPEKVVSKWSKGYTTSNPSSTLSIIEENGKELVKEVRIPANAGYWMTQLCKDTSSQMSWNIETCNLAPTLQESVELLMKNSGIEP